MADEKYGLFIDYQWCTGCHSCEMACKVEHNFGEGVFGVKLFEDGPRMMPNGKFEYNYLPEGTYLYCFCIEDVFGDCMFTTTQQFEIDADGTIYFQ